MATNKQIKCPECERLIDLVVKPGEPWRVQAACDCGKGKLRFVYEADNPDFKGTLPAEAAAVSKNEDRS